MEERNLRILEYDKIRQMLTDLARSDMGKELCGELVPSKEYHTVAQWQTETEEGTALLHRIGSHPIPPFTDVRGQLKRTQVGSVLSMRDLLACASAMRAARSAQSQLGKEADEDDPAPGIRAAANSLVATRLLEEDIFAAIMGEDEMADGASPTLSNIRRKIRVANDKVKDKLNDYIRNPNYSKYLQDPIITVRSGRYVLPVRQEYRGNMPGLVHDQSSSGATLFVEPMAIVEINNEIRTLGAEEQAEIERILAEFSDRIADVADALAANLKILAHLDFVFAKGALSRQMRASQVKLNDNGYINIKKGRHPLINADVVVPTDLWLGDEFTTLVITGPNTGGKTVTLKTVGLFALMTQAGLQIPCELGSEMAVFDQVFADIGDEQSIEQSLSTFSSHMTNIVRILKQVTPQSLVLFDELGAGTDPTEGAALAIAILERLLGRYVRTLATTHYSELKAFALTTQRVENASVEFSVETLRPTYRLSIGIPGKSNAFEISRRLGLMEDIIAQAQRRLSGEQIQFEDVLSNAEEQRQLAQKNRESAEEERRETARLLNAAKGMQSSIEAQRQELLRKAKEDARRLVMRAQAEAEAIIESLKKAEGEAQAKTITEAKKALRDSLSDLSGGLMDVDEDRLTAPPKELKLGQTVYLPHLSANGTILKLPNDKGEVQLQVGIMKVNAHISQLREEKEEKKSGKKMRSTGGGRIDIANRSASLSCDVRGQMLEEAIDNVDKYLDDCMLMSMHEVQIIHGKGTGTLRAGLQQHLKRHPHVQEFRIGKFGEGEAGVTVVTLRN